MVYEFRLVSLFYKKKKKKKIRSAMRDNWVMRKS